MKKDVRNIPIIEEIYYESPGSQVVLEEAILRRVEELREQGWEIVSLTISYVHISRENQTIIGAATVRISR